MKFWFDDAKKLEQDPELKAARLQVHVACRAVVLIESHEVTNSSLLTAAIPAQLVSTVVVRRRRL
jgi:hypothetical protein